MRRRNAAILALLLLLASCKRELRPEAIDPSDMCDFCRMAISDSRFAGEILLSGGEARKFDDIGCLLQYARAAKNREQVAVFYVNDYEKRSWLRVEEATFVRSRTLTTPMNSGIIAFRNPVAAGEAAKAYKGEVIQWPELWK